MSEKTDVIERTVLEKLTGKKTNGNGHITFSDWWKFTLKILGQAIIIAPFAGVLVWNLWAKDKVEAEIEPLEKRVVILENVALSNSYNGKKTKMYVEGFLISQGKSNIVDSVNKEVNLDKSNDSLGQLLGITPELLRPDKIKGE